MFKSFCHAKESATCNKTLFFPSYDTDKNARILEPGRVASGRRQLIDVQRFLATPRAFCNCQDDGQEMEVESHQRYMDTSGIYQTWAIGLVSLGRLALSK